jgi:cold shock protein
LSVNSRGARHGDDGHSENGQCDERVRIHWKPDAGGPDVFVHNSAAERAGMRDLNEGQKIAYEVVANRRTGKSSADNLKTV